MHLEILVEDLSGKRALEVLIPKLINAEDTFRIHSYKGIGHIPKNMRDPRDASKRILLENLPKLLKGYGRTFSQCSPIYPAVVLVVCDLDDKSLGDFLEELNSILRSCNPAPKARFSIAIEEGEAWFLGDIPAIMQAYPNARKDILEAYLNDSICGTWELLSDAIYQGGVRALSAKGFQAIGAEKSRWAERISPVMNVEDNYSPSFKFFRDTVRALVS